MIGWVSHGNIYSSEIVELVMVMGPEMGEGPQDHRVLRTGRNISNLFLGGATPQENGS